jgi:hypothetical protein
MTSENPKPTVSRLVKLLVFWLISNKPDLCFHTGGENGGNYFPVLFRSGELIHTSEWISRKQQDLCAINQAVNCKTGSRTLFNSELLSLQSLPTVRYLSRYADITDIGNVGPNSWVW